ncbi:MAG: signal peptide peptidase SppA [Candidatus Omnitrophota bacterium]
MKEDSSFKKILRALDVFRRVILNIVFFIILFIVLALLFHETRPEVPGSTVLVLEPSGMIVEELQQAEWIQSLEKAFGTRTRETLLKDLIDAIDQGKDDPRVKVLLLNLDYVGQTGLTKLQDIAAAIDRFKTSGKKVIAMADSYNRNSYYLASRANEVYMHRFGRVMLEGYSRYISYFKDGLDKYGVDVTIFRVGKYKSAVEPYMRNDMSPEAKEANSRVLSTLWDAYVQDIAASRKLKTEAINDYTNRFDTYLKNANGDAAAVAVKLGFIDRTMTRGELTDRLISLVGEDKRADMRTYKQIDFKDYLESLDMDQWGDNARGDLIGVVVAKGSIMEGSQHPGQIGGDSTAELIRRAGADRKVKALVFRVDSPGGGVFASEVIREELERFRKSGKPIVISMSSVAASGGYWISMASDEVWAYPTTITGSIGIYGIFPTFQKPLATYLGMHTDGVKTNKMAEAFRLDMPISPEVAAAMQTMIDRGYADFVNLVAKARKKSYAQVDEIAQGRVWSGVDAYRLGLVDHLGNFSEAIGAAARLAKLDNKYKIRYFRQKPDLKERLLSRFFQDAFGIGTHDKNEVNANPLTRVMGSVMDQLKKLAVLNDPNHVYALCPDADYN